MLSVKAIERRAIIRKKVKDLIEAHEELKNIQVLLSREQPQTGHKKFISVYFLAGDVEETYQHRTDSGKLVVRIGLKSVGDVDAELDEIAIKVVSQLGDAEFLLDNSVDEFSEVRWEYGAPENSSVTFLALIYAVEFTE